MIELYLIETDAGDTPHRFVRKQHFLSVPNVGETICVDENSFYQTIMKVTHVRHLPRSPHHDEGDTSPDFRPRIELYLKFVTIEDVN